MSQMPEDTILDTLRALIRPLGLGRCLLAARQQFCRSRIGLLLGFPDVILCTADAYGDTLLLSVVARELAKRGMRNTAVATLHGELFRGNPDVSGTMHCGKARCVQLLGTLQNLKFLHYSTPTAVAHVYESPREHIAAAMCRQAGISGEVELLPRICLSKRELAGFQSPKQILTVQSSTANAGHPIGTKEWYPERLQAVVDRFSSTFDVVQIGMPADPLLRNVADMRGKLRIRETASLLANSRVFAGLVGFLMHLARAVNCPAAIVYGGREMPWQSGYSCNKNLYRQPACAPCWREDACPHDRQCMNEISAAMLVDAIDELLAAERDELAVDRHLIN